MPGGYIDRRRAAALMKHRGRRRLGGACSRRTFSTPPGRRPASRPCSAGPGPRWRSFRPIRHARASRDRDRPVRAGIPLPVRHRRTCASIRSGWRRRTSPGVARDGRREGRGSRGRTQSAGRAPGFRRPETFDQRVAPSRCSPRRLADARPRVRRALGVELDFLPVGRHGRVAGRASAWRRSSMART